MPKANALARMLTGAASAKSVGATKAVAAVLRSVQASVAKPARKRSSATSSHDTRNPSAYRMRLPYREECLGPITSAGATFTNVGYVLNPGNNTTFPWLSAIALKFEKYRFVKLRFRLVSTSADAVGSTNTALGSYVMNTNYDVLDSVFSTQQQMEDYGGKTEAKPSVTAVHEVSSASLSRSRMENGLRFVLSSTGPTATYPTSSSAHDYDVGLFQMATVGQQATSVIGRLYVGYEVELVRPKLETPLGQGLIASHYTTVPVTASGMFGTAVVVSGSTMSITFTSTTMQINSNGRFLIAFAALAGTSFTKGTSPVASAGATFSSTSFAASGNFAGSATANFTWLAVVDVAGGSGLITWGVPTIVGGATADLYISQIPGGLTLTETVETRFARLERALRALEDDPGTGSITPRMLLSRHHGDEEFKGESSHRSEYVVVPEKAAHADGQTVNMTSSFVRAVMDMAKASK